MARQREARPLNLSAVDRAVVDETRAELMDDRPPEGSRVHGWLAVLLGVAALIAWPRLLAALPGLSFFTPFAMLGALVAVFGGLSTVWVKGGALRTARAATEAALRVLDDADAGREAELRAATVLVLRALVPAGDGATAVVDTRDARGRLGERIALVLAVEAHLVDRYGDRPVFGERAP